jgi:hypothetical protein
MPGKRNQFHKVNGEVIFIDESGNPGLSSVSVESSPYYAIGFVYCKDPSQLRTGLRRLLKRVHERKWYPPTLAELKFYLPRTDLIKQGYTYDQLDKYQDYLPAIREKAIEIVRERSTGVFGAVVDKKKAHNTWTPERLGNYVFAQTLFLDVMNSITPQYPPSILYDRGRLSPTKTRQFEQYFVNKDRYFEQTEVKSYKGQLPVPKDQSSYAEPGIWAADLVAGAFECKYTHGEPFYADLLGMRYIRNGERLYWP